MNINSLITALIVGVFASVAFILIQPLFGMATLTSRHAAAYVNIGGFSEASALILSWIVHIGVSICYALVSICLFKVNHSLLFSLVQMIGLGWLTTLIATPANEFVVSLITTKQFPVLHALPPLNTDVGPKLWLHILFFAFILGPLFLLKEIRGIQYVTE